jgi:hypothetical protein
VDLPSWRKTEIRTRRSATGELNRSHDTGDAGIERDGDAV